MLQVLEVATNCDVSGSLVVVQTEPAKSRKARKDKPTGEIFDPVSHVLILFVMHQAKQRRGIETHEQLAEASGVKRTAITGMVNGKRGVNADHLLAFFSALGMSLSQGFYELGRFVADRPELDVAPKSRLIEEEGYSKR